MEYIYRKLPKQESIKVRKIPCYIFYSITTSRRTWVYTCSACVPDNDTVSQPLPYEGPNVERQMAIGRRRSKSTSATYLAILDAKFRSRGAWFFIYFLQTSRASAYIHLRPRGVRRAKSCSPRTQGGPDSNHPTNGHRRLKRDCCRSQLVWMVVHRAYRVANSGPLTKWIADCL